LLSILLYYPSLPPERNGLELHCRKIEGETKVVSLLCNNNASYTHTHTRLTADNAIEPSYTHTRLTANTAIEHAQLHPMNL
jgi:hypothetical protein